MLHNLYSFHYKRPLQNATALPAFVYRAACNRRAVNNAVHIMPPASKATAAEPARGAPDSYSRAADGHIDPGSVPVVTAEFDDDTPGPFPDKYRVVTEEDWRHQPERSGAYHSALSSATCRAARRFPHPDLDKILEQRVLKEEQQLLGKLQAEKKKCRPKPESSQPGSVPVYKSTGQITDNSHGPAINKAGRKPGRAQAQAVKTTRVPAWKPGQGSVEKVDRLSGEILHLAG